MKVNEFINKMQEVKSVEELIVCKYIPVSTKKAIALKAISQATIVDGGYTYIDKFVENIYFSMIMFGEYTGVEVAETLDVLVAEYDKACESGVLDEVLDVCLKDVYRATEILEFEENKLLSQNTMEYSVAKLVSGLNDALTNLADSLADKIEDFDINSILPEGTGINSILDMLNKLK
jgi:hypothetical protein